MPRPAPVWWLVQAIENSVPGVKRGGNWSNVQLEWPPRPILIVAVTVPLIEAPFTVPVVTVRETTVTFRWQSDKKTAVLKRASVAVVLSNWPLKNRILECFEESVRIITGPRFCGVPRTKVTRECKPFLAYASTVTTAETYRLRFPK